MKALLAAALVCVTACGGDSESAYQGIYEAVSWTENLTSCDSPGDDVLAQQFSTVFYVKEENFLGTFLNLKFCDDVADCEDLAADDSTINLGSYFFDQGSDGSGWRSEYFSGFADDDDVCQGSYRVVTMNRPTDDTLRVEARETEAGGFAPDSDGFCEDEPGKAAAEGQPCTGLEVFEATLLGDLP